MLSEERARWPRWRNGALKPAPTWFRGDELDFIDAEDRRVLFLEVAAKTPPIEWTQLVVLACVTPMCLQALHLRHAGWAWAIGAGAWICVILGVIRLRRHGMLTLGRRALRERADWPQRLNAATWSSPSITPLAELTSA